MKRKEITVTVGTKKVLIPLGSTVQDALMATQTINHQNIPYSEYSIVGALVNYDVQPFSAVLSTDCTIEPVVASSPIGKRMYRHSICFLLSCAAMQLYPNRKLVIGHSLGDGYYFSFDDEQSVKEDTIEALTNTMKALVSDSLPIEQLYLPYHTAVEYFSQPGFEAAKLLLSYRNDPTVEIYKLGNFMDVAYEPLVPNTSLLSVWELRQYGDNGMLLRYPRRKDLLTLSPWKDNPLLFSIFKEYKQWGKILGVTSLGRLNQICSGGDITAFIRMAESLQEKKIASIADAIHERQSVKVVFIAGPSSSGKTTFSHKLSIQLEVLGYHPVRISLDNYYYTKDKAPKDVAGNPDLEAFEALDIPLFQQQMELLYQGKTVDLPRFEFTGNGRRWYPGKPIQLQERSILIIEGIHGLNPMLSSNIDSSTTFKVYISALTQLNLDDHNRISTTDNRLLRRMVRDNRTRNTPGEQTLAMWASVQHGEKLHIFPHQNNADIMLNSALDYELAVLAPFATPLLRRIKPTSDDTYPLARRLLKFLENVSPIPASLVPGDSLLREFIGGSEFDVH